MICDKLKNMRLKELENDCRITKCYLGDWRKRILDHIDNCKDCQSERLSEKTSKEDAI